MDLRLETVSAALRAGALAPASVADRAPTPAAPRLGRDVYVGPGAPAQPAQAAPGGVAAAVQALLRLAGSLVARARAAWRVAQAPPAAAAPAAAAPVARAPVTPAPPPPAVGAPGSQAPAPLPPAPPPPPLASPPPPVPAPPPPPVAPPVVAPPAVAPPAASRPAAPAPAVPAQRPGASRPLQGPFYVDRGIPAPLALYGATGSHWLSDVGQSRPGIAQTLREAAKHGETPVFVQYTVPNRDVGGPSKGGAGGEAAYLADIQDTARAIGDANAVVILEPDALASSLDPETIRKAVAIYKQTCPNLKLYIDIGHSAWCPVDEAVDKLVKAGVAQADGFALNTSAFEWTTDNLAYGNRIVDALIRRDPALADKQFVIDTSRNGNGPGVDESGKGTWGDPVRARNGGPIMNGPLPTTETGDPRCAAFLWIKLPGFGDNRTRHHSQFGGADWVAPTKTPPRGPVA